MKFQNLPADCLLYLFNTKLTLQELFRLRSLSNHLRGLIESAHCIGRRRSLKIFWCFDDIPRYAAWLYDATLQDDVKLLGLKQIGANDDDLRLCAPNCWEQTCVELARLLPNIQHLMIFFSEQTSDAYKVIPYLITRWRHSLRGLSLFGTYHPKFDPVGLYSFGSKLIGAINELPHLVSLINCVENLFNNTYAVNRAQEPLGPNGEYRLLPVRLEPVLVAQLERLFFIQPSEGLHTNVLRHLSSACCALELDYITSMADNEVANCLLNVGPCTTRLVPSRITSLRMSQDLVHIGRICARFTKLCSLVLRNIKSEVSLEQVLPHLRMLTRLTELKLVDFDFYVFERNDFVARGRLPVLGQVRSLTIQPQAKKLLPFIAYSGVCPLTQPDALFGVMGHVFPNIVRATLMLTDIFRDEFRAYPIEPKRHFVHFRSMNRFTLYITPFLYGNYCNLLSRHHFARERRDLADKWRSSARIDFIDFTGVQIWNKNKILAESTPEWTTNGAEMNRFSIVRFPHYPLKGEVAENQLAV